MQSIGKTSDTQDELAIVINIKKIQKTQSMQNHIYILEKTSLLSLWTESKGKENRWENPRAVWLRSITRKVHAPQVSAQETGGETGKQVAATQQSILQK